jgi:hypothetical protein
VVTELQKRYSFNVEVVKKTAPGLLKRFSLPKFPALEIDEQLVFEGQEITFDELEREIRKRLTDFSIPDNA